MKIKGPGGPTGTPDIANEPAGEATQPKDVGGPSFADRLHEPAPTGGPSGPSDAVASVAADLKAGKITPRQAVDRMMDLAVKGPAGKLPPKVQEKIRADLENLVKEDPYLRSKLERIGVPSGEDD